ncbi:MAG: hypothetical protein M1832_004194 [Thelocarpon impressellum]|nr:MAG: hypothetical protein M1832_004194 [Thelocarpon impressellum]
MATSRSSIHWAALIYVLCLAWASGSNAARGRPSGNGSSIPSLTNVTVDDLATGLEAGRFTSVDLVKAYLARIDQLNPVLHAVTEVNPDAIAIARDLDEQRRAGNVIG